MSFVLLLGGARSGKSALAQRLGAASGGQVTVIATAEPKDADMSERIRRHREGRPASWTTIEAPIDVAGALRSVPADRFVIVDCLTLWVANLQGARRTADEIGAAAAALAAELATRRAVAVSNEVGLGIVPANERARAFRDVLGSVNGVFAAEARRTLLIVAGRGLDLTDADLMLSLPPD
jgi:adenosyl cobinamide kinase/adenosyl cobinamide phosphate guanylyltransferase